MQGVLNWERWEEQGAGEKRWPLSSSTQARRFPPPRIPPLCQSRRGLAGWCLAEARGPCPVHVGLEAGTGVRLD